MLIFHDQSRPNFQTIFPGLRYTSVEISSLYDRDQIESDTGRNRLSLIHTSDGRYGQIAIDENLGFYRGIRAGRSETIEP